MPKCIILSGIPNSGKSTWAKKNKSQYNIISCDAIRNTNFGKYTFTKEKEAFVWHTFYDLIAKYTKNNNDIIIDNTNLKVGYLMSIGDALPENYEVEVKPFHIKLWRAKLRNYIRYIRTGKWIPNKVMNNMYKNYKLMLNYYE